MQKGLKKYFVNMDEYLSSLGLYRKMVARDASSLFRAVSEQLYYSQNYHQRIRQDCANFMRANRCNFEPFVEGSFEKYLERLEDPKETVGQVEIKALSQLYRRCFLIYRYPGKPATVISEDDFVDKVMLCCSINGHYDIVYPRNYPISAALCQSVLYELLYTQVFGVEEAELSQAMEAFRVGGRRYRNSPSMCSDVDIGYDTPEDRGHRYAHLLVHVCISIFMKPPGEAPPTPRLSLPYKVLKSLDMEVYRNLEFDVWQDTCKEMQKTEYMVFAGRQYFLGDKCQVRLEPKGKYYNAFIQEVGTQSSAVTVFIEELGEKHLVPLTDLKPVNPVPAWNIAAPSRKGDLGPAPSGLPPRFQPAGHPRPPPSPSPGAITFDPYGPSHHPHATARPPRYGAASSNRFLNRHLIQQQHSSYRVRSGSGALPPAPPHGNTPVCSSEEDQEDTSTVEDQGEEEVICSSPSSSSSSPSSPSSRLPAAAHLPPSTHTQPRSGRRARMNTHAHSDYQVNGLLFPVAMAIPAASPWLVNELGETLCTVVALPPYSYDPNGSDLPRDCRVVQYYFNLGVQWYHQSCWQQQQVFSAAPPEAPYPYQHYSPYLSQDLPLHGNTHTRFRKCSCQSKRTAGGGCRL
uniref:UDP-N-acetylglucosamine transferase subunit ALG13 n=1 Tax=Mola mola TaxID=94237 RepID=A0A3Q4BS80_MOLML